MVEATCPHISAQLKKRNLHLVFDDTNGIGTVRELAERALEGTGWSLGECDTIYEADGKTEKIRTYTCSEKTGAYNMLAGICDKFVCYPIFHGDTKTVDIRARSNKTGLLELRMGKNLNSIKRTRNSADIITCLHVEGQYGDTGYVGIEDINPTGLSCLFNFDYYREIGVFTEEHETALAVYLSTMKTLNTQGRQISVELQDKLTALATKWGTGGYLIYRADGALYNEPIYGDGADEEDQLRVDDTIARVMEDGTYTYVKVSSLAPNGEAWAVKFLKAVSGTLGGKEVALEAKSSTKKTLEAKLEAAKTETEANSIRDQLTPVLEEMQTLNAECATLMKECIGLAEEIDTLRQTAYQTQADIIEAEQALAAALGAMLQEGYYSDDTFVAGQEEALYNDALVMLKMLSRPQIEYSLDEADLKDIEGYQDEIFELNTAAHILCDDLRVSDYGFVSSVSDVWDEPGQRKIQIETDELNIGCKSFTSFMSRITDAAQLLKDEHAIYRRAEALSPTGEMQTGKLDGVIDVLKNRLTAAASSWYTDERGNLVFESTDGSSAMMLSGSGFMLAEGKDEDGYWNWRTFGTGAGFTADMMTTGVLRAGLITIFGSDRFLWNGENIYVMDPENENKQIRIGCYDGEHMGIAYTQDGGASWQTAIGFEGVQIAAGVNTGGEGVQVQITKDRFEVNVPGTDGDFVLNEAGGRLPVLIAETVTADNLTYRYTGPTAIYVNPDATSAQVAGGAYFRSLTDACASLTNRTLTKSVTIYVQGDSYGNAVLNDICGGSITIQGGGYSLIGTMEMSDCTTRIYIYGLSVTQPASSTAPRAMWVINCRYVAMEASVRISGNGGTHALVVEAGSAVWLYNVELYNATNLLYAVYNTQVTTLALKGGNCTNFAWANGCILKMEGSRPDGALRKSNAALLVPNDPAALNIDYGAAQPTAPSIITTSWDYLQSDSYAGGWNWVSDNDVRQGYNGTAIRGVIWFDAAAMRNTLNGKAINHASLRLHMHKGVGRGVTASIQLYGSNVSPDKTAAPALTTSYGAIGNALPGEINEISIPVQVITDIVNGTIQALVLKSDDAEFYKDRGYSRNYARFSGSTTADANTCPKLTVVYQE